MKKFLFGVLLSGIGVMAAASTSQAAVLGQIWENQTAAASNATIANAPAAGTGAYAEFNTSAINYNSTSGYTPALFLNNPTFFNATGTFDPNGTLDNSYILFTGQTFLNAGANSFVTPHDDGFELSIPGASFDLSQPGPTAAVNTPYTVNAPAAGLYNFTLSYGECCGPPAVLAFTVNGAPVGGVPEPFSIALLGLGLAGAAAFRARKTS